MARRVRTVSGAVYEFDDEGRVRRASDDHVKRADGDWQKLRGPAPEPTVGMPMVLVMESLAGHGRDDYDTPPERCSPFTTRVTTPVAAIEDAE